MTASLLVCVVAPPRAHAYSLGGNRWPGHVVTYWSTLPASWYRAIDRAAATYTGAGANIRFQRATSRARGQVIITMASRSVVGDAANATPGYTGGRGTIRIAGNPRRPGTLRLDKVPDVTTLVAHEFGHILGLNHVYPPTGTCILMDHDVTACASKNMRWGPRCRQLERDDVRGLTKLYGRARVTRRPMYCALVPAPRAPQGLTVTGADAASWDVPTLRWTYGASGDAPTYVRVEQRRRSGLASDYVASAKLAPTATSWKNERAASEPTASLCFNVTVTGRLSPSVTASVVWTLQPYLMPAPAIDTASVVEYPNDLDDYSLRVSYTAPIESAPAAYVRADGTCPVSPLDTAATGVSLTVDAARVTHLSGLPTGPICVSMFSIPSFAVARAQPSPAATLQLTHAAQPTPPM